MLRGCLLSLLLYAVLVAGYFFWFDRTFEPPGSYFGAAILGFVVLCSIGALMNAWRAWGDWSLLSSAERNLRPRGGRLTAVAGKIFPVGDPLIAPFSGEPCCLCEYDLTRPSRNIGTQSPQNNGSDFAGFLMAPCVVRAEFGDVRLLGYPIVESYGTAACISYASARRAIDFLTTREFENRAGLKIVTVLGVFEDVWSDEDGHVEKNLRLGNVSLPEVFPPELEAEIDRQMEIDPSATQDGKATRAAVSQAAKPGAGNDEEDESFDDDELDDEELDDEELDDEELDDDFESGVASVPKIPRMTEKRVPVGEKVCVIGFYNEQRGGLLPPGRGRHPNRLYRGTPDKLAKELREKSRGNFIGGILALILGHAFACAAMWLYQNSSATAKDRSLAAFAAVEQGDFVRLQSLTQRGMSLDIRGSGEATLLMAARKPEVARWLIERGVDLNAADSDGLTALMRAVREGDEERIRLLIGAKADLDRRSTNFGRTALMMAVSAGREDLANLLRQAGAADDVITAQTGQPLPEDGGPPLGVVRKYLAAVHARDPDTLARLFQSSGNGNYDFRDVDWELWHSCRPIEFETWSGFIRGDHATITVQGVGGGGYSTTWIYQLRRSGEAWKITREEDAIR